MVKKSLKIGFTFSRFMFKSYFAEKSQNISRLEISLITKRKFVLNIGPMSLYFKEKLYENCGAAIQLIV